jgi:hypothetical protein
MMVVRSVLQNPPEEPGAHPVALYTPLRSIDKATMHSGSCWSLDTLQAYGP